MTPDQKLALTAVIVAFVVLLCVLSYAIGYFRCYEKMTRVRQKENEFDERIERFLFCNNGPPKNFELN